VTIGTPVNVAAFELGHCRLDALVADGDVLVVRDRCGAFFASRDRGESFAFLRKDPGWASATKGWSERTRLSGEIVGIDPGRRLLYRQAGARKDLVAIRGPGATYEPLVGLRATDFGTIAWTDRTVLGSDGGGPLVARGRIATGMIASATRPFAHEWVVLTTDGTMWRTRKIGRHHDGDDPHALAAADDLDRWLLSAPSRDLRAVARGVEIRVEHVDCSSMHPPVTYRSLLSGAAHADAHRVRALSAALRKTAIPERWSFGSQLVVVSIELDDGRTVTGRYGHPSPITEAMLSAFGG
jgi:hypothetical protein